MRSGIGIIRITIVDVWHWLKKRVQGRSAETSKTMNGVWCVVANVVDERPYGQEQQIRNGTKHFSPGATVYCFPPLWGDGYEQIKVIGSHRTSHQYLTIIMPSKWLTNWRVKMVYRPAVIVKMPPHWDDSKRSHEQAEMIVTVMPHRRHDKESSAET